MTAFPCACCRACRQCEADDRKRSMQRVYGRGYHDGFDAAVAVTPAAPSTESKTGEKTMTPTKQRAALQGQSAIAMKIYDAIPIAEAWEAHRIIATVQSTHRTHVDKHVLDGCLNKLFNSSLIRQDDKGRWQRVKVRDHEERTEKQTMTTPTASANEKPALTLAHPMTDTPDVKPSTGTAPLEALAAIAVRLRDAATLITGIVDDLEAAAIVITESTVDPEELTKLRQLRALLKTL